MRKTDGPMVKRDTGRGWLRGSAAYQAAKPRRTHPLTRGRTDAHQTRSTTV